MATRTLLADRFNLVVRRETRQLDIYSLTMARPGGKPGSSLTPSAEDCAATAAAARSASAPGRGGEPPFICGMQFGAGRIRFGGYPLTLLANGLANQVGRAVVDRTGLTGNWNFELTYAPDARPPASSAADAAPIDPDAPNLFTALQEQLGLKLESTKGPVEVLIIERVERPTPD
jgi:bla regulator protein blaR1